MHGVAARQDRRIGFAIGGSSSARITFALLVLALGLSALSFFLGPADVTASQLVGGLFNGHGAAGVIAREIRLPRAALALFVGAA
jgi:iron complex transport system permease protein